MTAMEKKTKIGFIPLVMAVAVLLLAMGISGLEQDYRAEGKRALEEAVRQTALGCYAAEGVYPPDVAYMQEHYGLQYDESRYTVSYEIYASNLMPDITVLDKGL